jgi:hypothetical protein
MDVWQQRDKVQFNHGFICFVEACDMGDEDLPAISATTNNGGSHQWQIVDAFRVAHKNPQFEVRKLYGRTGSDDFSSWQMGMSFQCHQTWLAGKDPI